MWKTGHWAGFGSEAPKGPVLAPSCSGAPGAQVCSESSFSPIKAMPGCPLPQAHTVGSGPTWWPGCGRGHRGGATLQSKKAPRGFTGALAPKPCRNGGEVVGYSLDSARRERLCTLMPYSPGTAGDGGGGAASSATPGCLGLLGRSLRLQCQDEK